MPGYFTGMITRTAKRGVTPDGVILRIKWSEPTYFLRGVISPGITDFLIDYSRGYNPEKFFIRRMDYHVKNH